MERFSFWLKDVILDPIKKANILFVSTNTVLGFVALFMSIINIATEENVLLIATGSFALLCVINIALFQLGKTLRKITYGLFVVEMLTLFTFFIVSGLPQGFSIIWVALLPSSGLLLFKTKAGTGICTAMFVLLAFFCVAFVLFFILETTESEMKFLTNHDPLTGAFNRKGFDEVIKQTVSEKSHGSVGFLIADLDLFKTVNDTYGHFAGDQVLKETVRLITEVTNSPVCRWGGEEFAIFVIDGTQTERIANAIREAMDSANIVINGGIEIHQTISIGAYMSDYSRSITSNHLCKRADVLLYRAKASGRNHVNFATRESFDSEMI